MSGYDLRQQEFYNKIKNHEQNAVMLTKCYFNKLKHGCVYPEKIEKKIKKYTGF